MAAAVGDGGKDKNGWLDLRIEGEEWRDGGRKWMDRSEERGIRKDGWRDKTDGSKDTVGWMDGGIDSMQLFLVSSNDSRPVLGSTPPTISSSPPTRAGRGTFCCP
ncbi:40S ribosomal protein S18 [Platysternon megacephalum]|uniref:40S ribosomal protein S18 n=1 Tax=Platysternon megacephalum TaxID=55544 RepID=A0A4D9DMJ5_9SAUR|nr:40S ribosomal protein S18 [Platysternon megacephalum]